jgi:hypothetical protein
MQAAGYAGLQSEWMLKWQQGDAAASGWRANTKAMGGCALPQQASDQSKGFNRAVR